MRVRKRTARAFLTGDYIRKTQEDTDAAYRRAMEAGGTSLREPMTTFYGDRSAGVKDPGGNSWWIACHVEDVSPEEMVRRMKALSKAGHSD